MDHNLRILIRNTFHFLQRYPGPILDAGGDCSEVPLPLSQHDKLTPCKIGFRIIGSLRTPCHQADRRCNPVNVLHELLHEFHIPDIHRESNHFRPSHKDAPQDILIPVIDGELHKRYIITDRIGISRQGVHCRIGMYVFCIQCNQ